MTKIEINSDDPIGIHEWAMLNDACIHNFGVIRCSSSQVVTACNLEMRGFAEFSKGPDHSVMGYARESKVTPEGFAFFNFVRNIAPR